MCKDPVKDPRGFDPDLSTFEDKLADNEHFEKGKLA